MTKDSPKKNARRPKIRHSASNQEITYRESRVGLFRQMLTLQLRTADQALVEHDTAMLVRVMELGYRYALMISVLEQALLEETGRAPRKTSREQREHEEK